VTTELQVVAQEAPAANKALLVMLRELLRHARAGEIQSLGVAFIHSGVPEVRYECDEGDELILASTASQLEEVIRHDVFSED
jgi:hypothetical protein